MQSLHLAPVLGRFQRRAGQGDREGKPAAARNLVQHHAERVDIAPLVA
jgi:hypothetical protein